jgi:hypothetical protein
MYCPNCGKNNPENQKFCSSCGLCLQATSEVLAQELADKTGRTAIEIGAAANSNLSPVTLDRPRWQNPLVYAWMLIMVGIAIAFIGHQAFVDKTVGDIGTLIALLGIGLIGFKGVMMIVAPPKAKPRTQALRRAERTTELPRAIGSGVPASITENTTRKLDVRVEGDQGIELPTEPPCDTQPTLSR